MAICWYCKQYDHEDEGNDKGNCLHHAFAVTGNTLACDEYESCNGTFMSRDEFMKHNPGHMWDSWSEE